MKRLIIFYSSTKGAINHIGEQDAEYPLCGEQRGLLEPGNEIVTIDTIPGNICKRCVKRVSERSKEPTVQKRCSMCKEWKDRNEYNKCLSRPDGLRGMCKACVKNRYRKPKPKKRKPLPRPEQREIRPKPTGLYYKNGHVYGKVTRPAGCDKYLNQRIEVISTCLPFDMKA